MSITFEFHHIKTPLHTLVDIALDNKQARLTIDINARNNEQLNLHAEAGSKFKFVSEVNRVIDIKSKTASAELWDFGLEFIELITEADKKK